MFLLKGVLAPNECETIIREARENTIMTKALSDDSDINDKSRYRCKVAKLDDARLDGFCCDIGDAVGDKLIEVGGGRWEVHLIPNGLTRMWCITQKVVSSSSTMTARIGYSQ